MVDSTYHPNADALLAARNAFAGALGVDANKTTATVSDRLPKENGYYSINSKNPAYLVVESTLPDAVLNIEEAKKKILDQLQTLAPLKNEAQLKTDDNIATETVAKLKKLTAGTDFNQDIFKWPGFDAEVIKKSWRVGDHMVHYHKGRHGDNNAYGVSFSVGVPTADHDKGEELEKKIIEDLSKPETQAHFKEQLGLRVAKYAMQDVVKHNPNVTQDELKVVAANAQATVMGLKMVVNEGDGYRGGIRVSLRTERQAEAFKTAVGEDKIPDNATELKAGNPLNGMPDSKEHPLLQKALARALQDTPEMKQHIPLIAGRADIRTMVAKGLSRIRSLENESDIKAIIDSNMFKDHESLFLDNDKGKDNAKPVPDIKIEGQKLTITMDVPSDKMPQLVKDLGAPMAAPAPIVTVNASEATNLSQIADQIIAAGNALSKLGRNAPASSWTKKEDGRDDAKPLGLG